jgi:hypothetical protein
MTTKFWMIIRDDSKRTFEVCGQTTNDNSFTNKTHAMQKAGMLISCMTPPVTNKSSSKGLVIIVGYTNEEGLYGSLLSQYMKINLQASLEQDE